MKTLQVPTNPTRAKLLTALCLLLFSATGAWAIYNPQTGRWLSRDPIGEKGGLNLYGLLSDDPIDRTDYLGLALSPPSTPTVRWWDQLEGQTKANWNFSAATTKGWFTSMWQVKIRGHLRFLINLDPRNQNMGTSDRDNMTIRQHEEHHVDLWSGAWNSLKASVDPYEGKYCRRICATIAVGICNTFNTYYKALGLRDNVQFDLDSYGYRMLPEDRNNREATVYSAQRRMRASWNTLDELENRWRAERCP